MRLCARLTFFLFLTAGFLSAASAPAAGPNVHDTRLLSEPAISADRIAFVYAGDVWTCGLDGGSVRRVTSDLGLESRPAFSPDGQWIAFSGQYEGNTDVYVVAADGGVPRRLTWHPGNDIVNGFTPDGKSVLFSSPRAVFTGRYTQFFTVPLDGGPEQALPIPQANRGVYSPDGKRIAYNPGAPQFLQWKRYRGGAVSVLWLYDVATHAIEKGPAAGNPRQRPRADVDGRHRLFPVRPGRGVEPLLLRHEVPGHPPPDQPRGLPGPERLFRRRPHRLRAGGVPPPLRPRDVERPETDHRRGGGPPRDAAPLRQGNQGEEVHPRLLDLADRRARGRRLSRGDRHRSRREGGRAQPDQQPRRQRAFPDLVARRAFRRVLLRRLGRVRALDREPGRQRGAEEVEAHGGGLLRVARVVARQQEDRVRGQRADALLDRRGDRRVPEGRGGLLLRPGQDAAPGLVPRFAVDRVCHQQRGADPDRFGLRARAGQVVSGDRRALRREPAGLRPQRQVPLLPGFDQRRPGQQLVHPRIRGPARPQRDLHGRPSEGSALAAGQGERRGEGGGGGGRREEGRRGSREERKEGRGAGQDRREVRREAQGAPVRGAGADRFRRPELPDPGPARSGGRAFEPAGGRDGPGLLRAHGGRKERAPAVRPEGAQDRDPAARRRGLPDFGRREEAAHEGEGQLDDFGLLHQEDRGKRGRRARGRDRGEGRSPRRVARDLPRGLADQPRLVLRPQHARGGLEGDAREVRAVPSGPGHPAGPEPRHPVDVQRAFGRPPLRRRRRHPRGDQDGAGGAPRRRLHDRERALPIREGLRRAQLESRSALAPDRARRGREGRRIPAGSRRKGRRAPANLYSFFENTSGKLIEITVGPAPDGKRSRTVSVVPVANELQLRNRDWVEGNRRKVDAATGGRVAYVYVPNTADQGYTYFTRYFYPQANKDAVILDERHNSGGSVADYYIDVLQKKLIAYWTFRYGSDMKTPSGSVQGPKVLLADEDAGSGGDLLPWMFRKFQVGPIVGKRTWGGLVGVLGFPELMDGGAITAPNIAFWDPEKGWTVENEGVPPDVEVDQVPAEVIAGHDPQLERAIAIILEDLKKNPPTAPKRPPYPVKAAPPAR